MIFSTMIDLIIICNNVKNKFKFNSNRIKKAKDRTYELIHPNSSHKQ